MNIDKFIKVREGYYLLRTIAKNLKFDEDQTKLITMISKNFLEFAKSFNGSLLLQCIIHNFPLSTFSYTKSSISCVNNNNTAYNNRNQSGRANEYNHPLDDLYTILVKHINQWDNNKIKAIIECAIKFGSYQFGKKFLTMIINYLASFMNNNYSIKILKLMMKSFDHETTIAIISLLTRHLRTFDKSKQEKLRKLLENTFNTTEDNLLKSWLKTHLVEISSKDNKSHSDLKKNQKNIKQKVLANNYSNIAVQRGKTINQNAFIPNSNYFNVQNPFPSHNHQFNYINTFNNMPMIRSTYLKPATIHNHYVNPTFYLPQTQNISMIAANNFYISY